MKVTQLIWLVIAIAIFLASVGGWIANIVKLVCVDEITGLLLARAIGIPFIPLGVVLGYL